MEVATSQQRSILQTLIY